MKGRETTKSAPSADLLLCFPSRANFTLRPKPICGPGMPLDTGNCRRSEQRPHLKRSVTRGGQASPLLWAKPKQMGSEISEPTSPKVTCSGQIKVRPRTRPCKSWQSVMEEIEKIHHSSRKHKRRSTWFDSLGVFKKDVVQFLTCLRSIRFDLQCFGTSPVSEVETDDEDEDGRYEEGVVEANFDESTSRTIFSKWFMVLQENQNCEFYSKDGTDGGKSCDDAPIVPPPNALLLMRCRSAPVKRLSASGENGGGERDRDNNEDQNSSDGAVTEERTRKLGFLMNQERMREEDEERKRREAGILVDSSDDIGTGRGVVSRRRDPFSRSRSWKR
ncbi:uncharacterized protein LOC116203798 [Punica granatum]|uniref:Uncharacterized protein LOC116203798 n=2 Tax=Punica granatum TaxID=22663 RepID=A0A6P8DJ77_PUNGR|nr:uncharacterized protein LOC116203798 [Punica granatum]PKI73894.1 hypothetical protein CRG98_005764 [Punica granatum]